MPDAMPDAMPYAECPMLLAPCSLLCAPCLMPVPCRCHVPCQPPSSKPRLGAPGLLRAPPHPTSPTAGANLVPALLRTARLPGQRSPSVAYALHGMSNLTDELRACPAERKLNHSTLGKVYRIKPGKVPPSRRAIRIPRDQQGEGRIRPEVEDGGTGAAWCSRFGFQSAVPLWPRDLPLDGKCLSNRSSACTKRYVSPHSASEVLRISILIGTSSITFIPRTPTNSPLLLAGHSTTQTFSFLLPELAFLGPSLLFSSCRRWSSFLLSFFVVDCHAMIRPVPVKAAAPVDRRCDA